MDTFCFPAAYRPSGREPAAETKMSRERGSEKKLNFDAETIYHSAWHELHRKWICPSSPGAICRFLLFPHFGHLTTLNGADGTGFGAGLGFPLPPICSPQAEQMNPFWAYSGLTWLECPHFGHFRDLVPPRVMLMPEDVSEPCGAIGVSLLFDCVYLKVLYHRKGFMEPPVCRQEKSARRLPCGLCEVSF